MRLNQFPIKGVSKDLLNVRVAHFFAGTVQLEVLPVADARHQIDAQQIGQTKDGRALSLRIGMQGVGLDFGLIFEQTIQNINRFPYSARNEMAEERDVGIGDMVIPDPAITAVAKVIFREQILFIEIPLRAVGGSALARAPMFRQGEPIIAVNNLGNGCLQILLRDVALIDPGDLPPIQPGE